MVTGFGFPEVGFHRIPDFGFKKKFSYQLEKFFLTSKVPNGIRINNLIKIFCNIFTSYFVKYKSLEESKRNKIVIL